MKLITALLATAVLACTLAPASAQTPRFSAQLTQGAQLRYNLSLSIDVLQRAGEEEASRADRVEHAAQALLTVESIDTEGAAVVALAFDVVSMRIVSPGQSATYTAARDPRRMRDFPALQQTSTDETLSTIGRALLDAQLRMSVRPDGTITSLVGLDDFLAAYAAQSEYDERILGFFTPVKLAPTLELIFSADPGNVRPAAEGKGWQSSERVDLGAIGAIDMVTNWTVLSSTPAETIVDGTLSFELLVPAFREADVPELALAPSTGTTHLRWNTANNRLIERAATQNIETVWSLGDIRIEQTQTSVSTIRFIAPE